MMPDATMLFSDMRGAAKVLRSFDPLRVLGVLGTIGRERGVLICGEGSSRIFPGKRARSLDAARKHPVGVSTFSCTQAAGFDLADRDTLALSNSGKTAELIAFLDVLRAAGGHGRIVAASAFDEALLRSRADAFLAMSCGPEAAVAATKSILEQALIAETLCSAAACEALPRPSDLAALASIIEALVETVTPEEVARPLAAAGTVYVSGPDGGVAEELALKAIEILGKRSIYLEGTLLLHGIEECMQEGDALVLVAPVASTLQAVERRIHRAAKVSVVAIADFDCGFAGPRIPAAGDYFSYAALAAGWRMLLDSGIAMNRDVDHPMRAQKIGNAYTE